MTERGGTGCGYDGVSGRQARKGRGGGHWAGSIGIGLALRDFSCLLGVFVVLVLSVHALRPVHLSSNRYFFYHLLSHVLPLMLHFFVLYDILFHFFFSHFSSAAAGHMGGVGRASICMHGMGAVRPSVGHVSGHVKSTSHCVARGPWCSGSPSLQTRSGRFQTSHRTAPHTSSPERGTSGRRCGVCTHKVTGRHSPMNCLWLHTVF